MYAIMRSDTERDEFDFFHGLYVCSMQSILKYSYTLFIYISAKWFLLYSKRLELYLTLNSSLKSLRFIIILILTKLIIILLRAINDSRHAMEKSERLFAIICLLVIVLGSQTSTMPTFNVHVVISM